MNLLIETQLCKYSAYYDILKNDVELDYIMAIIRNKQHFIKQFAPDGSDVTIRIPLKPSFKCRTIKDNISPQHLIIYFPS